MPKRKTKVFIVRQFDSTTDSILDVNEYKSPTLATRVCESINNAYHVIEHDLSSPEDLRDQARNSYAFINSEMRTEP